MPVELPPVVVIFKALYAVLAVRPAINCTDVVGALNPIITLLPTVVAVIVPAVPFVLAVKVSV